ncbi:hypothetical protein PpBr36_04386 [Pyricularia pennisetigena]|uniref:hypothetical protein n=1 Tax=Pyricularia pennisetigena TaxID=1578925 RepID=UPI00114E8968|nr:hypothetical protein PpBr36_04386 [Pyricularia pennisetigena]TLS27119.1 hypothetical protein PpBr36_04386 [Pyricularia pennisetigena]
MANQQHPALKTPFGTRAQSANHPLSSYLLRLMELKQSNLCLSADVTTARELIYLAEKTGPSIVVLKTHYDLISGWDYSPKTGTGAKLAALARRYGFLIFEDRKFADIGKTVQMQYTAGTARIIEWAHITNINIHAGKDSVRALAEAAAKWRERIKYEVRTSVSVGTPLSDSFEDDEDGNGAGVGGIGGSSSSMASPPIAGSSSSGGGPPPSMYGRDADGRKGSIVSITTVTQSFEPADSPRLSKSMSGEGVDDLVFPGIEEAPMERGLLILAQMSSKGCLMTPDYTAACVEAARENRRFVMGFVAQEGLNSEPDDDFITMTPGCKLPPQGEEENGPLEGDGLGQQYNTPTKLIGLGTDIVIVGRGIIKADDPQSEAERYRRKAWSAYQERCDREHVDSPCGNCVSRNKQDVCRYESLPAPPSTSKRNKLDGQPRLLQKQETSPQDSASHLEHLDLGEISPSKEANFGYANTTPAGCNGVSTLGLLLKIDKVTASGQQGDAADHLTRITADSDRRVSDVGIRERYKSILRRLPNRDHVERLAEIFLEELNPNYYPLEPDLFRNQLAEWYKVHVDVLEKSGPYALTPEMRPFGALLFEIIAIALLLLPSEGPLATHYKELKDGGGIKVVDLAMDYSESGVAILSLLGKRQMSLTTIQAGFIRANFLKYSALVTEAWHAIGSVIRDAQEIGLHREALEPKPEAVTAGDGDPHAAAAAVLRNQWHIQHRRRLWHILFMWDAHTAAVLGRPTSVGEDVQLPLPVDCLLPRDRSSTPVQPRSADDPPTPLTRMLWALRAIKHLRQILKLEAKGTNPRNFAYVDKLHQDLERLEDEIPPQFRLENPDTSFDDHPDCRWLRSQRTLLPQMSAFNFIVLHRQYVFTRTQSRTEALKACLKMLGAQQIQFAAMKPEQYRAFSIFFGTFDAVILLATLYIVFPKEHLDLLPDALQHFRFAVERFSALSETNNLARAGVGVLRAIFHRMRKSLTLAGSLSYESIDQPWHKPADAETVPSLASGINTVTSTGAREEEGLTLETAHLPGASGAGDEDRSGAPLQALGQDTEEWSLPVNFDWSAIQPIAATSDLLYNDLMVGGDLDFSGTGGQDDWQQPQAWWPTDVTVSENDAQAVGHDIGSGDGQQDINSALQFEGHFEQGSIWNMLNLYNPL